MSHHHFGDHTPWRRSSHSTSGPETNCLEAAHVAGAVGIRDSKDIDSGILTVELDEWLALLNSLDDTSPTS